MPAYRRDSGMMRPSYIGITRASQARETGSTPVGRFVIKMQKLKFWFIILILDIGILNFMGCATTTYTTAPISPGMPGSYHKVEKGQTLWRISQVYHIDLDEIISANHISDASRIEAGQLIFIPHQYQQPQKTYASSSEDFIWPMRGKIIAPFGQTFNNMANKGINIRPFKSGEVVAARSGKVIFYADDFKGFGKTLIIDHGDGLSTVYSLSSQVLVKPGDVVNKGTLIAKVGLNQANNKNTYLHFEIRKASIAQNPYFYLSD